MGCGKSKHDVAAGNTITRKKSINVGEEQSKKENDKDTVETIAGTGQIDDKKTDSSSVVVQQKEEEKVRDTVSDNVIVEKDQNPSKVVEGKDDIGESKELIKEGNGEIISKESTAAEDAALREAAVVSKGKSEDDTPAQESGKDGLVSEIVKDNAVKKEEDLVEETTEEESKNEGLTETLEKEIEAAADIEAKAEAEAASESKSEEKENTADPPSTEGKDS